MARKKRILIYGDWIFDQYWYLSPYTSTTSSHTSATHNRARAVIQDVCGAGHIAHGLASLLRAQDQWKKVKLYCVGSWRNSDTPRSYFRKEERGRIKFIRASDGEETVVRRYYGDRQISRDDLPHPCRHNKSFLKKLPEKLDLIIVFDLDKGAVRKKYVKQLANQYREAKWVIRSKKLEPSWNSKIPTCELIAVGSEVLSHDHPLGTWQITGRESEVVSRRAVEHLTKERSKNVLLAPGDQEIIAKLGDKVVTGRVDASIPPYFQIGWSSIVTAFLSWHLLHKNRGIRINDLRDAMYFATSRHPKFVQEAKDRPEVLHWDTPGKDVVELSRGVSLRTCQKHWAHATDPKRLLSKQNRRPLELWRATADVPNYICLVNERRDEIDKIARKLHGFLKANVDKHLGIYISADPGSGKTHLVRQLTATLGFSSYEVNVTHFLRVEDFNSMFDELSTRQVTDPHPLAVYVDEINAEVEKAPVWSRFLTPLEEGYYQKGSLKTKLRPCVWIFTGTEPLDPDSVDLSSDKKSDFAHRMSLTVDVSIDAMLRKVGTKGRKRLLDAARLEQLYLGATLIRQSYPAVHKIDESVLNAFFGLSPHQQPSRRIRRMVGSMVNVRSDTVTAANFPDDRFDPGKFAVEIRE